MARRRPRQQRFVWKARGGARAGAGRKRAPANVGLQPHRARPEFDRLVPVHVTMRANRTVPNMRSELVARLVKNELARASAKGFRLLHYSVQSDHLHLIAEAEDAVSLSRGMQRLASRIAMAVNAFACRRGAVWRERYHRRDLASPRQFRNALVYVTFNIRKHAPAGERRTWANAFDLLSSGIWIDDWTMEAVRARAEECRARAGPRPTVRPETWLARVGWKRHGLLDGREAPRSPA